MIQEIYQNQTPENPQNNQPNNSSDKDQNDLTIKEATPKDLSKKPKSKKRNTIFLIFVILFVFIFGIWLGTKFAQRTKIFNPPPPTPTPLREADSLLNRTKLDCIAEECLQVAKFVYPITQIDPEAKSALLKMISYQHKSIAISIKAIEQFGNNGPFKMIFRSKESDLAKVKALLDKYDLPIQDNVWLETAAIPTSTQEACLFGSNLETEIINELTPSISKSENHPDINYLLKNILQSIQKRSLPAYQNCQ